MSEQEFRSYRLVSMSEPSDEMLAMLMEKAVKEVRKKNQRTQMAFFENLRRAASSRKESRTFSN